MTISALIILVIWVVASLRCRGGGGLGHRLRSWQRESLPARVGQILKGVIVIIAVLLVVLWLLGTLPAPPAVNLRLSQPMLQRIPDRQLTELERLSAAYRAAIGRPHPATVARARRDFEGALVSACPAMLAELREARTFTCAHENQETFFVFWWRGGGGDASGARLCSTTSRRPRRSGRRSSWRDPGRRASWRWVRRERERRSSPSPGTERAASCGSAPPRPRRRSRRAARSRHGWPAQMTHRRSCSFRTPATGSASPRSSPSVSTRRSRPTRWACAGMAAASRSPVPPTGTACTRPCGFRPARPRS